MLHYYNVLLYLLVVSSDKGRKRSCFLELNYDCVYDY